MNPPDTPLWHALGRPQLWGPLPLGRAPQWMYAQSQLCQNGLFKLDEVRTATTLWYALRPNVDARGKTWGDLVEGVTIADLRAAIDGRCVLHTITIAVWNIRWPTDPDTGSGKRKR